VNAHLLFVRGVCFSNVEDGLRFEAAKLFCARHPPPTTSTTKWRTSNLPHTASAAHHHASLRKPRSNGTAAAACNGKQVLPLPRVRAEIDDDGLHPVSVVMEGGVLD
jgi:hypothetical protein